MRVVSATNREPAERVARGAFREDLLYRLNLIARPPAAAARAAASDIPLLAATSSRAAAELRTARPRELSRAAVALAQAQPWPGNVRQLKQWSSARVLVTDARPCSSADDFAARRRDGGADAAAMDAAPCRWAA